MTTVASFEIPTSGKWYWEIAATTVASAAASRTQIGIMNQAAKFADGSDHVYADVAGVYAYAGNGQKAASPGTFTTYGASFTSGDVIGVAVDADNGTIAFYKNGAAQGTAYSGLDMSTGFSPSVGYWGTFTANFGQRPFVYTPPTGFLPLHTGNLPDSAIVDGSEYFNPVLYTGNGSNGKSITGVGFQTDFNWTKSRSSGSYSHQLSDVVRGFTHYLYSNATNAEGTDASNHIQSVNSDGYVINSGASFNASGVTYVAWNWKANGAGVSNTDGSITSTVSASPTAGFSVVTYTGTGANATVGHGLGAAPKMIIVKERTSASGWIVQHDSLGWDKGFLGITTAAASTSANFSNNTAPTADVFTIAAYSSGDGTLTRNFVVYCFSEVPGYSSFGSYTGNGSADGPFVYLGFRPKFILVKSSSNAFDWHITDTSRAPYNQADTVLFPNSSAAETNGGGYYYDLTSNGFKCRNLGAATNGNGYTYIYMAFAENPFKNSLAR